MNEQDDTQKQDDGSCGPGCCCSKGGTGSRGRRIAGIAILLVAGVLVVRAMIKEHSAKSEPAATSGFTAFPAERQTSEAAPVTMQELSSLADLNTLATDTVGVFVFVPGKNEATATNQAASILSAIRMIEPQLDGGRIGAFTLNANAPEYEQLASQMAVPGVLAMIKGGGINAVSEEITETKLVQALVAASSSGGCGPSAAGCGPTGCK